ncbi:response regulator [Bdellovibrionota bacterium FG-1]
MKSKKKILVVDANSQTLKEFIGEFGRDYEVASCADGKSALEQLETFQPEVLVVDEALVDTPFTEILGQAANGVIRIVTTAGLPDTEKVFDSVSAKLADTCFVKPLNYLELRNVIERIAALRAGHAVGDADIQAVYQKVHTIFDKVSDAEKLQKEAQSQLEKARKLEEQSLARVENVARDHQRFKQKISDLEKEMGSSKDKAKQLQGQNEVLTKEKEKAQDTLKEIEIQVDSTKSATLHVSADLKVSGRQKIDGKDSVLFVDDEEDLRKMFSDVFKSKFNIHLADCADAAVMALTQHPEVALVVTDCRMPRKTGIELSYEIRKTHPDLPIFLLTGFGEMDAAIKAMNEGAIQQYYGKPFKSVELSKAIREGIDKSDDAVAQKTLISAKKGFVVDRIKDLVAQVASLEHNYSKVHEEEERLRGESAKMSQELVEIKTERDELRVSVVKEREQMRDEMAEEKRKVDADIAKRMDEATRLLETERQKYKDELVELELKFKADKEKAELQLAEMRKKMEAEQAIEQQKLVDERQKLELQLAETRKQMEIEKADIEAKLVIERKRGEEELARVQADIAGTKARIEAEIRQELIEMKRVAEAEIEILKKTVTKDLDKLREESIKKEKELNEKINQVGRTLREKEDELNTKKRSMAEMEKEMVNMKRERDVAVKEHDSMRGEYDLLTQSRDALDAELSELKGSR